MKNPIIKKVPKKHFLYRSNHVVSKELEALSIQNEIRFKIVEIHISDVKKSKNFKHERYRIRKEMKT